MKLLTVVFVQYQNIDSTANIKRPEAARLKRIYKQNIESKMLSQINIGIESCWIKRTRYSRTEWQTHKAEVSSGTIEFDI